MTDKCFYYKKTFKDPSPILDLGDGNFPRHPQSIYLASTLLENRAALKFGTVTSFLDRASLV